MGLPNMKKQSSSVTWDSKFILIYNTGIKHKIFRAPAEVNVQSAQMDYAAILLVQPFLFLVIFSLVAPWSVSASERRQHRRD